MTAPILITGACGRLGRAVQRVGEGRPFVAVSSPRSAGETQQLDITDAAAVLAAITEIRPRVIIHLASMVGATCQADPAAAEAVNVVGTANLLSVARAHGVDRIVFASTAGVYGDSRAHALSELDATAPSSVYAATKLRAEQVLEAGSEAIAVDALRVFNIYGPEMPDSLVTRLQAAASDAPVRLSGLDDFVRDYVHVDDVARALLASADSEHSGFRVLNVGSGIPRSNRNLLEALPASARSAVTVSTGPASYSWADITAIGTALSWQPRMPWHLGNET